MKPHNLNKITTDQDEAELSDEDSFEFEAEYNLRQYIQLVWRIYQRIKIKKPRLLTEIFKRRKV